MAGLYQEDSESIARPVNWLVSVKCQYLIEYLHLIQGKNKPNQTNTKQLLVAGGFPPEWEEGQIISCGKVGLRDRDALEGRGKEAQRDCWTQGEGSIFRGGMGSSSAFCRGHEPIRGRFGLSVALIDWEYKVVKHTRKLGVTKLWI